MYTPHTSLFGWKLTSRIRFRPLDHISLPIISRDYDFRFTHFCIGIGAWAWVGNL